MLHAVLSHVEKTCGVKVPALSSESLPGIWMLSEACTLKQLSQLLSSEIRNPDRKVGVGVGASSL